MLELVEYDLTNLGPEEVGVDLFSEKFVAFEEAQPALAARVTSTLARPMGETPLALGYFLSLSVWMSFERLFGTRVRQVTEEEVQAAMEALQLDEELRQEAPDEAIETDDVIAMEQPALVDYIREHIDVALEDDPIGVEVEEVDAIYRMVLLLVIALSYAVEPPGAVPEQGGSKGEWQA
ncbi:MAG: hypothetical protein RMJ98_01245 [Myxococcales bacterium]|nr:hypothetical protein [Polyangiaceae bacterium]MDW8247912.1 hypothetical protein [Myxococcales bacterium]